MKKFTLLVLLGLYGLSNLPGQVNQLFQANQQERVEIRGELKKWHRITLVFDGPESSEMADDNPFLNYRLDVTFTHQNQSYVVPGFYAADGNAAETGANAGNKWMVRFTPDHIGRWEYTVSFKKGKNIAILDDIAQAASAGFADGLEDSFEVVDTDKTGIDNRAQGRLNYVGEPYLKYQETGGYFVKLGVDAPENLLAYEDIDATTNVFGLKKNWAPHRRDAGEDVAAFVWQGKKGRNLMGAINYLASEKLNVFSFLTFNVDGDDRNVFPYLLKVSESDYTDYANDKKNKEAWQTMFHKTRLDVSKLEQWERIFEYAERKGMFLHFKTHETETDHLMDNGVFGAEGKLYYRELIARFSHHLAMNWNLGEENNQPIEEVKKAANYVHRLDPYKHHLVIHTFPNKDDRYAELIGDQSPLTGASLQLRDPEFHDVHPRVLKWREKSDSTGKRWALAVDEPGKANTALLPDAEDPEHNLARANALWGTLMAGGFGVEWYFGYASPHSDLTCQDFRSRDLFWDQNRHAHSLFEQHLPFWRMESADELTADTTSYCLAEKDKVYAVYLHPGTKTTSLDLGDSGKQFSVHWYNPRSGGELRAGSVKSVIARGIVSLGFPPENIEQDWVALIRAEGPGNSAINTLLSRLNLNKNGLEQVKAAGSPKIAAAELLAYYRKRTSVKHPISQESRPDLLGNVATEKDLTIADNALQHIFVGQPAYPPHFCGDDINWNSRPVPDMEWVWQLNRMYFWDAMGRAYWHTGEEKYAEEWCRQLLDWTRKNPNDEDHKYAWRSIETGIRGYRWPGLFQRFIEAPSFTPEVLIAFLNSCYDHAEFLMTKYRTGSNWGLMEAEGMAFIAVIFPEFKDAEKWKTEAFRRLNNEINIQVHPDGHQKELAMGYHLGCINWFWRTYELAKMNGLEHAFPGSYEGTIEKMCEVPMKLGHPDGTNAQFGDAWTGTPGQHKERYLKWAERFDREDFLYLATEGKKGTPPAKTAFALEHSGLYSMRSGWDTNAICLVLKCGPDGGGHCQRDNGTFELYARGRNLMPDAGSYIYSGNPEGRAWFRQTQVHQTLTLNGKNTEYAPQLLLWKQGEALDVLVVENASYENLSHRRAVFFVDKRYFVIVDEAFGNATGDVDLHFQLAPGEVIFNHENLSVTSDFKDGWNIHVQTLKQAGLQLEKEEGQVSFVYTKKEPRPAFRFRIKKDAEAPGIRMVTLVTPFEEEMPDPEIAVLGNPQPGSSQLQLKVSEKGEQQLLDINSKNK